MSKKPLSLNIFHKLLLTLLLVTLVPLLGLWYLGANQSKQEITGHITQTFVATAASLATSITAWDDTNVRLLHQTARQADIVSMQGARQNPILKTIAETYEWAFVVFTIAPDGGGVGRSDFNPLVNYAERSYFQAAMRGDGAARQVVISKTSGKPVLSLAAPIRNNGGDVLGVVAMAMTLTDIARIVSDARVGETGYAILLDANNNVIAHGLPEKRANSVQDFSLYPALRLAGVTEAPRVYQDNGKQLLAYVRKLPQGWTLIIEQDYAEAYAALDSMERNARQLIAATTVLVAAIAFFLSKRLTRPINHLTAVAQKLSSGQFQLAIPQTARGDEIGSLARAIERLGISIELAMDRLRRKA